MPKPQWRTWIEKIRTILRTVDAEGLAQARGTARQLPRGKHASRLRFHRRAPWRQAARQTPLARQLLPRYDPSRAQQDR
jgi:hypothetical protein